MVTYKLFRLKCGKLYPLFVDTKQEMPLGEWLEAKIGELADAGHVKSRLGSVHGLDWKARGRSSSPAAGYGLV